MTQQVEIEDQERHLFRTLFKLAVVAGLVFIAGRFLAQKKLEYADLTESQARDRLVDTIAPTVGDDTAEDIADQVIPKLKDRGLIKPDPVEAAADKVAEVAEDVADAVSDTAEKVADKAVKAVDKATKAVK